MKEPLALNEVQILIHEKKPGETNILFKHGNYYYDYLYFSSGAMGGISIHRYQHTDSIVVDNYDNCELIYSTFNNDKCTQEGRWIEYSIMKWNKAEIPIVRLINKNTY